MSARLGLVFYTCGHQDPVPSGDRHVNGPCRMCIRRSRVCDYGHDHPWSDWSFDDCQRAADVSRKANRA
jgi:hypothetical protein